MNSKLFPALVCFLAFNAAAEFRAGIAVRTVTPDPLLPVSGGLPMTHSPRAEALDRRSKFFRLNCGDSYS